jgi:hypothetical protein
MRVDGSKQRPLHRNSIITFNLHQYHYFKTRFQSNKKFLLFIEIDLIITTTSRSSALTADNCYLE